MTMVNYSALINDERGAPCYQLRNCWVGQGHSLQRNGIKDLQNYCCASEVTESCGCVFGVNF